MIRERGLPDLPRSQQTVILGAAALLLTSIGTVAMVETSAADEIDAVRRREYARLSGTVLGASLLGALALALGARHDGLRGVVG